MLYKFLVTFKVRQKYLFQFFQLRLLMFVPSSSKKNELDMFTEENLQPIIDYRQHGAKALHPCIRGRSFCF